MGGRRDLKGERTSGGLKGGGAARDKGVRGSARLGNSQRCGISELAAVQHATRELVMAWLAKVPWFAVPQVPPHVRLLHQIHSCATLPVARPPQDERHYDHAVTLHRRRPGQPHRRLPVGHVQRATLYPCVGGVPQAASVVLLAMAAAYREQWWRRRTHARQLQLRL
uniref:Uncharacterized protein n=1 Tax=Arundo donax TaxID=35708 RepID=A0A0A9DHU7_ARUDO